MEMRYNGSWKQDKFDGKGNLWTFIENKSGTKNILLYDGQFKSGERHGKGTSYDESGSQWRKDLYEGQGSYIGAMV